MRYAATDNLGSGVSAAYAYDPLDRRVSKTGPGVTNTWFLYAGGEEMVELSSSGAILRRFGETGQELIRGINSRSNGPGTDQPLAEVQPDGTASFFHTDRRGSTVAMSDETGSPDRGALHIRSLWRWRAHGGGVPFKYTGRYARTRKPGSTTTAPATTAPALGRFLQTDPIGYERRSQSLCLCRK